jgi:DnaJ-class molecular chaperone
MDERETSQTDGKTACPHCLGTGSREGEDCITCGGTGVAPEESA